MGGRERLADWTAPLGPLILPAIGQSMYRSINQHSPLTRHWGGVRAGESIRGYCIGNLGLTRGFCGLTGAVGTTCTWAGWLLTTKKASQRSMGPYCSCVPNIPTQSSTHARLGSWVLMSYTVGVTTNDLGMYSVKSVRSCPGLALLGSPIDPSSRST